MIAHRGARGKGWGGGVKEGLAHATVFLMCLGSASRPAGRSPVFASDQNTCSMLAAAAESRLR